MTNEENLKALEGSVPLISEIMENIDEVNKTKQSPALDLARLALHDAKMSLEDFRKALKELEK